MTTAAEPDPNVPYSEVIAQRLAEWAERDATIGLRREVAMQTSLKDSCEESLRATRAELERARQRIAELEAGGRGGPAGVVARLRQLRTRVKRA